MVGVLARPISAPTAPKRASRATGLVRLPPGISTRERHGGNRRRGLHRHAGDDGARSATASLGARPVVSSPAPPAGWARLQSRCLPSSATRSSPRPQEADYLKGLGAAEIIDRKELAEKPRALAKERWAVRSVPATLANVLSMTRYGCLWTCRGDGLAHQRRPLHHPGGMSACALNSVMCPLPLRREAWKRLEIDLDRAKIAAMTTQIGLAEVIKARKAHRRGPGTRANCG